MKHNGSSPSQEMVIAKVAGAPSEIEGTPEPFIFYAPIYKAGSVIDVQINHTRFLQLLYSFGFRRYDMGKSHIFIRVENQIVQEVTIHQIQDFFKKYLEGLPETLENIKRDLLLEKFCRSNSVFFSDKKLGWLDTDSQIVFNTDTKNESFIYYKNVFVRCTANGWSVHPYKDLKGLIWKNQMLNRDFAMADIDIENINSLSTFAQFMYNFSDKDRSRFKSICSITGYILHSFYQGKRKAIILTDSAISENPEGRSGKTLFGQAFGHIKNLCVISGKDFDFKNKHKYSNANLDTQILFLNDLNKNFDIESLFNDITEGVTVDKKNQAPFPLNAIILIATNQAIKIEGGSAEDRVIEFEFSGHYRKGYEPKDDFNEWFFLEWNRAEQWNSFDNFMMYCISLYLKEGIISAAPINLNKNKLLNLTCGEFVEFMQSLVTTDEIKPKVGYDKKILHEKFLSENPELRENKRASNQAQFTKWLKSFGKYSEHFDGVIERKSNSIKYIEFKSSQSHRTQTNIENEGDAF